MGRLDGKVAIITGSGIGIGRASALLFAAEGARVVVAELSEETGSATAEAIGSAGGQGLFVQTDVTQEASVRASIARTIDEYGRLDILYNNAGGSTIADASVTETPVEEFWRAISLDLFGTWLCCRCAIPEIVRAGGGAVVNTASAAGVVGIPNRSAYSAAKGGVIGLTRQIAFDYASKNVRANALAPSVTGTERVMRLRDQMFDEASLARADSRLLMGLVTPEDVAYAALYLASDEARVTTGQVLPIDSGRTMS